MLEQNCAILMLRNWWLSLPCSMLRNNLIFMNPFHVVWYFELILIFEKYGKSNLCNFWAPQNLWSSHSNAIFDRLFVSYVKLTLCWGLCILFWEKVWFDRLRRYGSLQAYFTEILWISPEISEFHLNWLKFSSIFFKKDSISWIQHTSYINSNISNPNQKKSVK